MAGPSKVPSFEATCGISLRVYHESEKPRNGRRMQITDPGLYPDPNGNPAPGVSGVQLYSALSSNTDLERYTPHVYSDAEECFVPVLATPGNFYAATPGPPARLDVKLVSSSPNPPRETLAASLICDSSSSSLSSSWFGIGICRGKVAANHGSLWRTALQFGASYTFTIGKRYDRKGEGAADVFKSHRQMPCFGYADVSAFFSTSPVDAQIVAVEYGGTQLVEFRHPKRAVYLLGSEDAGLPPALVERAHHHVSIPVAAGRPASLNVAAAGAIVLWDRCIKISAASRVAAVEQAAMEEKSVCKRNSAPATTDELEGPIAPIMDR